MSEQFLRNLKEESKNEYVYEELERLTSIFNRTQIVFGVEGERDESFYGQIIKTKVYSSLKWEFYVFKSKNLAINFLESHIDKDVQKVLKNKLLVILDKDYGMITLDKDLNHIKAKYQLHITKHHSLENYYFAEKNLELILKRHNLKEKEIAELNKRLDNFIDLVVNYEALVVLNTKVYNIEKNNLQSDISIEAASKIRKYFYKINELKELSYADIKLENGKFKFETKLLNDLINELTSFANKTVPNKLLEIKKIIKDKSVIKGKLIYYLFYENLRRNRKNLPDLKKIANINHLIAGDFIFTLSRIGLKNFIEPVNL
jgi:hypothetical protein